MMVSDEIYSSPELLYREHSGVVDPVRVEKPWGYETVLVVTSQYAMKFLDILKGQRLSVQYHENKSETLHCLTGKGCLFLGEEGVREAIELDSLEHIALEPGNTVHVAPLTVHSIEAETDMRLVECSLPCIDDVVRLTDLYGRSS